MKTPEQIANEVLNSIPVGQYSTTAQMIVAAIEADREQRRIFEGELDELLAAWDDHEGDVDGFYQSWTSKLNRE